MASNSDNFLPAFLQKNESEILNIWLAEQSKIIGSKIKVGELKDQCREFLSLLTTAANQGDLARQGGPAWEAVRSFLAGISRSRGQQGFSPTETASFIFSLKKVIFQFLRKDSGQDLQMIQTAIETVSDVLDQLGLFTTESYQKSREEVILRQQEDMLELSTPVVKLWDGVLALPLIGTLDSSRTQVIMENLLQKIVDTNSGTAIIDITGVSTVDTLVAQHLIKTVTAARLMGAECIISGIRPQIAATIVHLGVDLSGIATKATLADAFALALKRIGKKVVTAERVQNFESKN